MADGYPKYETLLVTQLAPHVLGVELHRPSKLNSFNESMWTDLRELFAAVGQDGGTRAVVLSGAGRMFTAGLDISSGGLSMDSDAGDTARFALEIRRKGKLWQQSLSNIETCGKAVIACVHGHCIGAGIELIAACDIRFCTADASFTMAEVNIGMAADVGGLQRFPKILGNQSLVRELALSGRALGAAEASQQGFVSKCYEDKSAMQSAALELATQIAAKSPIATLSVKEFLNYARDHSVEESLDYSITWNMAMLQGQDMRVAGASVLMKQKPTFSNLVDARSKL